MGMRRCARPICRGLTELFGSNLRSVVTPTIIINSHRIQTRNLRSSDHDEWINKKREESRLRSAKHLQMERELIKEMEETREKREEEYRAQQEEYEKDKSLKKAKEDRHLFYLWLLGLAVWAPHVFGD